MCLIKCKNKCGYQLKFGEEGHTSQKKEKVVVKFKKHEAGRKVKDSETKGVKVGSENV